MKLQAEERKRNALWERNEEERRRLRHYLNRQLRKKTAVVET